MSLKRIKRLRRFVVGVWLLRAHIFRSPIVGRNLRAAWTQADADWLRNAPCLDLTDREGDDYMEALR